MAFCTKETVVSLRAMNTCSESSGMAPLIRNLGTKTYEPTALPFGQEPPLPNNQEAGNKIMQSNYRSHCAALLVGGSRDRSPLVSLGIFSVATNRTMCPGVHSASKNKYLGVKTAGA
jgi:hypothetical protein